MRKTAAAAIAAAVMFTSSGAWAQSVEPGAAGRPRGGDRVAAGVVCVVGGVGAGVLGSWMVAADVPGGAGPAAVVGAVGLTSIVVGVVEIVAGAREWSYPPRAGISLAPTGLVVRW